MGTKNWTLEEKHVSTNTAILAHTHRGKLKIINFPQTRHSCFSSGLAPSACDLLSCHFGTLCFRITMLFLSCADLWELTVTGKYLGMSQENLPLFSIFGMNAVNPALNCLQLLASQHGFVCHHLSIGMGLPKAGCREVSCTRGRLPAWFRGSRSEVVAKTQKTRLERTVESSRVVVSTRGAWSSLEWKVDGETKSKHQHFS